VSIFGKVKAVKDWNVLGYQLNKLKDAVEKEGEMSETGIYDPRITVKKAAIGIAQGALGVIIPALLAYLTDSEALRVALLAAGVKEAVILVLVPLIVGGARAASNRMKHA
jgi:hypothetical protein